MHRVTSIFVDGATTFDKLVELLSLFLEDNFIRLNLDDGSLYRSFIDGLDIEIDVFDNHDLVDDFGISFTSYEFEIRIESINKNKSQENLLKTRHKLAWKIVDKLSSELVCDLIVVDGLQKLVQRL